MSTGPARSSGVAILTRSSVAPGLAVTTVSTTGTWDSSTMRMRTASTTPKAAAGPPPVVCRTMGTISNPAVGTGSLKKS